MRQNDSRLRECNECPVVHYDNCPECFGFGVWRKLRSPITARDSKHLMSGGFIDNMDSADMCYTCRSSWKGVPRN